MVQSKQLKILRDETLDEDHELKDCKSLENTVIILDRSRGTKWYETFIILHLRY